MPECHSYSSDCKTIHIDSIEGPIYVRRYLTALLAGNFLKTAVVCVNIEALVICKSSLTGEKLE
jgi:hypothetical protein